VTESRNRKMMAIGVDLGSTNIRVALVRHNGDIVRLLRDRAVGDGPLDFGPKVEQIAKMFDQVLELTGVDRAALAGVGVGVGGHIDREGVIIGTNGPRGMVWRPFPFRTRLSKELALDIPVIVDNDSKVAAWGEYLYGAGRGARDVVCLTIGTGVGGGIIMDGKLVHGASGLAGHLGFVSVDMHGPRCPSGVLGCVEHYASGTAIGRDARQAIQAGRLSQISDPARDTIGDVSSRQVFEAARQGDRLAAETIRNAAHALGIATCSLLHTLNPEVVIIGGGVAEQGDLFLAPVRQTVREYAMRSYTHTPIKAAEMGNAAGVVGAAALCWSTSGAER